MNNDLKESIDVIALEFCNRDFAYIETILNKVAFEGKGAGENAIHLLAALSQV